MSGPMSNATGGGQQQTYNFPQVGMQSQQLGFQNYMQRQNNQSQTKQLGMQLGQRQNEAAMQNATQNRQIGSNETMGRLNNDTAMAGVQAGRQAAMATNATNRAALDNQQGRFNTVLPYFTDALSNLSGKFGAGYQGGGQQGTQPNISDAPVYTPQQMNQQVNAQTASNDMATQSKIRQMQSSMAGRGYGSQSPLLAALRQGYQNQNMVTNTANARDTRLNSAKMNSDQVLKAQVAREAQFANRQNEDIERGRVYTGALSPLLSALSGMV